MIPFLGGLSSRKGTNGKVPIGKGVRDSPPLWFRRENSPFCFRKSLTGRNVKRLEAKKETGNFYSLSYNAAMDWETAQQKLKPDEKLAELGLAVA